MKSIGIALIALGFGGPAFGNDLILAQVDAQETDLEVEETVPRAQRATVELKPITLISAVPGVGAVGLAFEATLGDKWAGFVEGSYADADLKEDWISTAKDETDEPIPEKGNGFTTGLGVRYYEDPLGDSVYAGGALSYGESRTDWVFNDAEYEVETYTATPSLFAGYRWIWRNGVLLRLGAGAGMPRVDSAVITPTTVTEDTEEGTNKIDDIVNQAVVAKLDMGVGYSF